MAPGVATDGLKAILVQNEPVPSGFSIWDFQPALAAGGRDVRHLVPKASTGSRYYDGMMPLKFV
jgi:hypothetical protein